MHTKIALRSNHPAANTQGFFKIILSQITPQSKLMIPEKFVRDHEDKLHGRIMLKAPGGAPWPVDVEREKGQAWLQNGWPEFAAFYSLCFGSLLVFEYVEHSNFQVRVFDASATEIYYPSTFNNLNHNEEALLPKVRKRVAEIVTSSRCQLMRACKKTRASSEEAFYTESKLKQEKANGDGGSASQEEIERAVDLAKTFESQNPFFIIGLRPSHVSRSGVDIRKTFRVIYRKWKKEDRVIFQFESTSWPVDCSMKGDRCQLNSGWKTFISDNLLNAGDVCVFELINPSRKLFRVSIFRAKREVAAA